LALSDKRVYYANGAEPRLIGTDALSLRVPEGRVVQEMIVAAGQRDHAEMDYAWPSPVTGNVENKHVFLHKVDDMVVGVGYYAR
jgi:signal transduction histidine kinase